MIKFEVRVSSETFKGGFSRYIHVCGYIYIYVNYTCMPIKHIYSHIYRSLNIHTHMIKIYMYVNMYVYIYKGTHI